MKLFCKMFVAVITTACYLIGCRLIGEAVGSWLVEWFYDDASEG